MTPRSKRRSPRRSRTVWIIAATVVVAAAIIAIAAGSGGSGKKVTTGPTTAGQATTGQPVAQTRPVTVRGTALPTFARSGADPARGTAAPELLGQTFDGQAIGVTADEEPKVVMMVAHWCPHCQREVPLLAQYFHRSGLPQGVRIVTVATDTNPNAPNYPPSTWLSQVGWPLPVMADDAGYTAAKAYGLSAFPYFVAISAQNKVVVRTSGELTLSEFNTLVQAARTGSLPPGST
jgi:cytochrome c biogenesis protein CcmG/thiol:disulfide interchange protein DsbE